jgi:hypothetical protein
MLQKFYLLKNIEHIICYSLLSSRAEPFTTSKLQLRVFIVEKITFYLVEYSRHRKMPLRKFSVNNEANNLFNVTDL